MKNLLFTLLSFAALNCGKAYAELDKEDYLYCFQFSDDAKVAMGLVWSAETTLEEAATLINDMSDEEYKKRMTNLLFWANAWPTSGSAPEMIKEFSGNAMSSCLDWERIKRTQDNTSEMQKP